MSARELRGTSRTIGRLAVAGALALTVLATATLSATGAPVTAGPKPNGTAVTPEGWRVTPAGTQTNLGPGPLDVAMSPRGNLLLVANAGYQDHSLMTIDPANGRLLQTIKAPGGNGKGPWDISGHSHGYYVGLAFSPDGHRAWASDGVGSSLHTYSVSGRTVAEGSRIRLTDNVGNQGAYPAGIAVDEDASHLYVAGNLADTLFVVDPTAGSVSATIPVGHLPYGVALNRSGSLAFVTNWGARTVSVIDTARSKVVKTIGVGTHPSAILANPKRDELYVANSDSDSVSVLDGVTARVLRTIDLRPYAGAPVGASPNALVLSPGGGTLYVANAGDNDLAVVRLGSAGATSGDRVLGLIPTGWYPSGVAIDPTGTTLFATNMNGLGIGPNLEPKTYWPTLMHGSLSRIPVPTASKLGSYTAQVRANDRFDTRPSVPSGSVVPSTPGGPTPIKHVIYVMKENRTYDQILGDLERGNGDPSLAIFGEDVTPNHHELARRFVTFDNFYADAMVSADGWTWTTGANANTYNSKNWPLDYNYYGRPYDFGGFGNEETAALPGENPGRGFLWDSLAKAGVSYRNFGYFVDNPVDLQDSIPGLIDHTDMRYPGWDLFTPDQVRMDRWTRVFQNYQRQGSMPAMQFVYLPSDHTYATTQEARRPSAYVADNDLALGRLVETVSHSQFWASTAIFVVEDDAQDGPDHVDAHRSLAYVISPYTQRGVVDSTFYSSVSVLRTMELILGAEPMSQYDAAATPMSAAFGSTPNLRPYTALTPATSLTATNGANAPMSSESASIDFSSADRIPMGLMNEILWKSVRGPTSQMPAPVHSVVTAGQTDPDG
jgi:YVTN family beta-propeller protein